MVLAGLALALIALTLLLGYHLVRNVFANELGGDYGVFYSASVASLHGISPYDHAALAGIERTLYPGFGVDDFPYLPIVAVLLAPATLLPFWVSFAVFGGISAIVIAASLRMWFEEAGWRRPRLWLIAACLLVVSWWALWYGQWEGLMLGGLVGSLILMRRNMPVLAGVCMLVVLLKPDVLWPLPLLIFAIWTPNWGRAWRFAASAGLMITGGAAAGFALIPGAWSFFAYELQFAGTIGPGRPDIATISGLFDHLPGGGVVEVGLAVLGVVAVVLLTIACLTSRRLRQISDGQRAVVPLVGLAGWLCCAPYAHSFDVLLLLPLLILLLGIKGATLRTGWLLVGVLGCLAITLAYLVALSVGDAALVIGLMVWAWRRRQVSFDALVSLATAALVVLPPMLFELQPHFWSFSVSLSPIVVLLIALAGVWRMVSMMQAEVSQPSYRPDLMLQEDFEIGGPVSGRPPPVAGALPEHPDLMKMASVSQAKTG